MIHHVTNYQLTDMMCTEFEIQSLNLDVFLEIPENARSVHFKSESRDCRTNGGNRGQENVGVTELRPHASDSGGGFISDMTPPSVFHGTEDSSCPIGVGVLDSGPSGEHWAKIDDNRFGPV